LLFFFQGFQHPTLSSVSTTLGEIGRGLAERDIASWSGLLSGSRKSGHCLCQEEAEEGEKRRSFERGALRLTVWRMARTEEMETHISRELVGTGVLN
jgi:hypothetical protein